MNHRDVIDEQRSLGDLEKIFGSTPSDVLGALSAQDKKTAGKMLLHQGIPAVVGLVLGAVFWKKHRVLGALGGFCLGGSAAPLITGEGGGRASAIQYLVGTGAGVALSLKWKKHPFWGYVLGGMAGGGAAGIVRMAVKK